MKLFVEDSTFFAKNKDALMKSSQERAPEFDCDRTKTDAVTRLEREYVRMKVFINNYTLFWKWAFDSFFEKKKEYEEEKRTREFIKTQKKLRDSGLPNTAPELDGLLLDGFDLNDSSSLSLKNSFNQQRQRLAALAALPTSEEVKRLRERDKDKLLVFGAGPHDVAGFTDRPAPKHLNLQTGSADAAK